MPLYELLCLAKPALPRAELVRMMQRVGDLIMERGGVLTDVRSYGEQLLAYDIRRPFERYDKAHIWQMNFMVGPTVIKNIEHELRVNKDVLRSVTIKRATSWRAVLGQQTALPAMQQAEEKELSQEPVDPGIGGNGPRQ